MIAATGEYQRQGGAYGSTLNDDPLPAYAADGLVAPWTLGKRVQTFGRVAP